MEDIMKATLLSTAALALVAAPVFAAGPLTTPEELNAMLGDENLAILDVRSMAEVDTEKFKTLPDHRDYAKGHIPGAVDANYQVSGWRDQMGRIQAMLPDPETMEGIIQALGVDNDDTVVIYTGGTSPKAIDLGSATRVYWTFKALGHDDVTILDGGFDGWVDAGYALSTEAVTPEKGDFEADLQIDMLVDGAMVELAARNGIELIDGRPTNQFLGQAQSGSAKNPGTIPGATSVASPDLVAEGGRHFKSVDELEAMFTKAGIEDGEEGYAFCNTGHFASVAWFAGSELLGRDVKLYDGSMYDWTFVRDGATVIGKLPEEEEEG
jgi:thiosulfate/3-mercaptopyruvate sulfurtransferase